MENEISLMNLEIHDKFWLMGVVWEVCEIMKKPFQTITIIARLVHLDVLPEQPNALNVELVVRGGLAAKVERAL